MREEEISAVLFFDNAILATSGASGTSLSLSVLVFSWSSSFEMSKRT